MDCRSKELIIVHHGYKQLLIWCIQIIRTCHIVEGLIAFVLFSVSWSDVRLQFTNEKFKFLHLYQDFAVRCVCFVVIRISWHLKQPSFFSRWRWTRFGSFGSRVAHMAPPARTGHWSSLGLNTSKRHQTHRLATSVKTLCSRLAASDGRLKKNPLFNPKSLSAVM